MNYIPATENDKKEMLKQIGVKTIDDLMVNLKPQITEGLSLSEPMSELELADHMKKLSQKNKILKYFIGAGAYNHYVPVCNKSSFNARRVPYWLHTIPSRNQSRNTSGHLRISIIYLPSYRHGCS